MIHLVKKNEANYIDSNMDTWRQISEKYDV